MNQFPPTALPNRENPLESARKSLIWGWCLVGGGCLLALVPFLGMLAWIIGPPLVLAGLVLSIIAMSKGRTGGGVALLLFSLIVAPATLIFAPIISSIIGASAASGTTKPLPEPLQNLPGSGSR